MPGAPTTQPGIPGQGANQAVNLIQQMLTSPRTPPAGLNTGTVTTGMSGIAGVGGSADGTGIHVIKDHSKYKQWEFIYDIKNDKNIVGAAAAAGNPVLQQQQQGQSLTQPQPQTPTTPLQTSPPQPTQTSQQ